MQDISHVSVGVKWIIVKDRVQLICSVYQIKKVDYVLAPTLFQSKHNFFRKRSTHKYKAIAVLAQVVLERAKNNLSARYAIFARARVYFSRECLSRKKG